MKHFDFEIIEIENVYPPVVSMVGNLEEILTRNDLKELIDELQEYLLKLDLIIVAHRVHNEGSAQDK